MRFKLTMPDEHKHKCILVLLDPAHDIIARHAVREYAAVARDIGHIDLANDLEDWINGMAGELSTLEDENGGSPD